MKKPLKHLFRLYNMLSGNCYYHIPQGLGKAFDPSILKGYYNDLTNKTNWKGLTDKDGIPINQLLDDSVCYFATTIIQKALGHYDLYIINNDENHFKDFMNICNWLINTQDTNGGWNVNKVTDSKYSAMSQGEAISAFVRAWKHTGNNNYFNAAKKAYDLMLKPIENGGTTYYKNHEIYLEEYPNFDKNTVLNGWIFALFGIYDLFLATNNISYKFIFDQSVNTLKNNLRTFDTGYWSYYNEYKLLASPFYHDLHINQLKALFLVTKDDTINNYIYKWNNYKCNVFYFSYAFIVKAYQKITNPVSNSIIR